MSKKVTIKTIAQSVLSSAFGIQNHKNHERDFSRGKALHYIIGGVIGTLLFVCLLLGAVQIII
ncbi:MAG: DUF2970 domain-containing protein [Endozoicomonas sp. (ex Botrylloides leachii)]|nr:DUF2970 domain-containing protein [Endozoicomonas sp. (ex Botrylloides leachii)]